MRVISHGALVGFCRSGRNPAGRGETRDHAAAAVMALSALMMFAFGLMIANFTSLAMEPQGHIAGTASSLYGSITTLLGIGIATMIGQDYDGTLLPFATGFFLCTLASLAVVLVTEKGRLFRPHGGRRQRRQIHRAKPGACAKSSSGNCIANPRDVRCIAKKREL